LFPLQSLFGHFASVYEGAHTEEASEDRTSAYPLVKAAKMHAPNLRGQAPISARWNVWRNRCCSSNRACPLIDSPSGLAAEIALGVLGCFCTSAGVGAGVGAGVSTGTGACIVGACRSAGAGVCSGSSRVQVRVSVAGSASYGDVIYAGFDASQCTITVFSWP
jgi:hypothetical protein